MTVSSLDAMRLLDMAAEMDRKSAEFAADAARAEWEAARAVERGNAARESARQAARRATRYRRGAQSLSRRTTEEGNYE